MKYQKQKKAMLTLLAGVALIASTNVGATHFAKTCSTIGTSVTGTAVAGQPKTFTAPVASDAVVMWNVGKTDGSSVQCGGYWGVTDGTAKLERAGTPKCWGVPSQNVTFPSAGTYYVRATYLESSLTSCKQAVNTHVEVSPALPTVAFSANPTSISLGASSTLTWSSTNATSCAGTGGWNQPSLGPSGSASVKPTSATTYSISCTGPGGKSSVSSVTVSIASPTVTLSANPTSIRPGASSTLTWTSTNATSCAGTGGWNQNLAISGSMPVTPASTATYSISCTGPGGTSPVKSVKVSVVPVQAWLVPILNFLLGG